MITIIAGSRTCKDPKILLLALSKIDFIVTEVVYGGAVGADTLGMEWASKNKIAIKFFPAEWKKYGKAAGFVRNQEMADYAEVLIALWDKKSNGTRNMINEMIKRDKPYIIQYTEASDAQSY